MLGFGTSGRLGMNGAFDKLRVWQFDASDSLKSVEHELGLSGSIEKFAYYRLGEPGTVGNVGNKYTPLEDSITPSENITSYSGAITCSIESTGLAAPGSTEALYKSNGRGYWYSDNFSLYNNWSLDMWIRPNQSGGSYIAGTGDIDIWCTHANTAITTISGNNLASGKLWLVLRGSKGCLGSADCEYTLNTWYRVSIIALDGRVYYYLNRKLVDSAPFNHKLWQLNLGDGNPAIAQSNGCVDELKLWKFWSGARLMDVEIAMDLYNAQGIYFIVR
jgi:hypothetical protein